MAYQIGATIVGLLLVIVAALWGLNGLRTDFGVATTGYRELRPGAGGTGEVAHDGRARGGRVVNGGGRGGRAGDLAAPQRRAAAAAVARGGRPHRGRTVRRSCRRHEPVAKRCGVRRTRRRF